MHEAKGSLRRNPPQKTQKKPQKSMRDVEPAESGPSSFGFTNKEILNLLVNQDCFMGRNISIAIRTFLRIQP